MRLTQSCLTCFVIRRTKSLKRTFGVRASLLAIAMGQSSSEQRFTSRESPTLPARFSRSIEPNRKRKFGLQNKKFGSTSSEVLQPGPVEIWRGPFRKSNRNSVCKTSLSITLPERKNAKHIFMLIILLTSYFKYCWLDLWAILWNSW